MTKQYRVKGIAGIETYIELLSEVAGGYEARITSINDHGVRESCEFISDELLDSCVRTGYLAEVIRQPAKHAVPQPVLAT